VEVRPPNPPLSDGVVTLREWTQADAPAVAAACGEDEIARWMPLIPQPYTEADARDYIASVEAAWGDRTGGTFAVVGESGEILGSIGMRVIDPQHAVVEVGYWAAAAARGRGLTTRALRLICGWLLGDVGAKRVQLRADVLNLASQRVAQKIGFVREGILRSSGYNQRQGRRIDYVIYSLLPGELG
jgi:RimJ/RimL family protein N-acetyltransferase